MKKIINGKKYDTETAELVGSTDNGLFPHDFGYICHELYRKRTGEYFLHSEGGANTRYAVQDGTGWAGGSVIEPMGYDDARAWAEEHMTADEYEAEFGEIEEAECDVALLVHVPASAKAALDREAARTGRTRASIVAELLASLGGAQKARP